MNTKTVAVALAASLAMIVRPSTEAHRANTLASPHLNEAEKTRLTRVAAGNPFGRNRWRAAIGLPTRATLATADVNLDFVARARGGSPRICLSLPAVLAGLGILGLIEVVRHGESGEPKPADPPLSTTVA